jgi:hypothetical protein
VRATDALDDYDVAVTERLGSLVDRVGAVRWVNSAVWEGIAPLE